jgi:hypothetical protein
MRVECNCARITYRQERVWENQGVGEIEKVKSYPFHRGYFVL